MSNENVIEIINTDYSINIEQNEYAFEVNNTFVSDYACLTNKPAINSIELTGNKTAATLNLLTPNDIVSKENISNKITEISSGSTNTQYASAKCVYDNLQLKADKNLANINQEGKNKLCLINACCNIGEVSTDAEVLAQLRTRYKSTFDKNKFTVTGSPVITDNGIASGFSASNDVLCNYSFNPQGSWVIKGSFILTSIPGANTFATIFATNTTYGSRLRVNSTGKLSFNLSSNNTSYDIANEATGTTVLSLNTTYYFDFSFDGSQYILKLSADGVNWTTEKTITSSSIIYTTSSTQIRIGKASSSYEIFDGTTDLKYFSITSEDEPVFNGNKTGIDQIKAENYTVVGSPTISDDGVASGFSSSNDILCNYSFNPQGSWCVKGSFILTSLPSGYVTIFATNTTYGNRLRVNSSAKLSFNLTSNNTSYDIANEATGNTVLSLNTTYYFDFSFDGSQYVLKLSTDGVNWTTEKTITSSSIIYTTSSTQIRIGKASSSYEIFTGSIDLNAFKIYVDGNLVYQACLRIPYTKSKTGSKIVDSYYRDRINDMYSQYGFAPYYTLSDTNFTLPKGEIYGFITNAGIIEEYVSGTEGYRVWDNGYCEQYGHLNSATTLTFTKEFNNANYFMYPTATKTTAGCTFSSATTSDWIAKGYLKEGEY